MFETFFKVCEHVGNAAVIDGIPHLHAHSADQSGIDGSDQLDIAYAEAFGDKGFDLLDKTRIGLGLGRDLHTDRAVLEHHGPVSHRWRNRLGKARGKTRVQFPALLRAILRAQIIARRGGQALGGFIGHAAAYPVQQLLPVSAGLAKDFFGRAILVLTAPGTLGAGGVLRLAEDLRVLLPDLLVRMAQGAAQRFGIVSGLVRATEVIDNALGAAAEHFADKLLTEQVKYASEDEEIDNACDK